MKKYDLLISENYVNHWNLSDAIREIFQNCLDQQIENIDNPWFWDYHVEDSTLIIGNKKSNLERSSLLIGNSTKRDNENTIGQFGEGYKLALLVLLREGYNVRILNYSTKEEWIPSLFYSKDFKSNILRIGIKKYIFKSVPDNDLTFIIENITPGEMVELQSYNLHIRKTYPNNIETKFGNVLLEEEEKGNLYVNGLFVQKSKDDNLRYGYDFKPKYIKLDRDRKLIQDIDLLFLTSELWLSIPKENNAEKFITDLIQKESSDIKYVDSILNWYSKDNLNKDVLKSASRKFIKDHGTNSIPVSTQVEADASKKFYPSMKPIIVSPSYKSLIQNSPEYIPPIPEQTHVKQPREFLDELFDKEGNIILDDLSENLRRIRNLSEDWRWK